MAKVLICDDEAFFRDAVSEILRSEEIQVLVTDSGEKALDAIATQDVGVVVLDVIMPNMDGLETLRRIKADSPDTQVIMFTAHSDEEVILNALRLGALDYLAKPIHAEELTLSVRKALRTHELHTANRRKLAQLKTLVSSARKLSEISEGELAYESLTENIALLQKTMDLIAEILDVQRVSIMLLDAAAQELRVAVANGINLETMSSIRVALGEGIAGTVAQEGSPILVENIDEDERFERSKFSEQYATKSFISAPLRISNRVVGVINANDKRTRESFTENDLALLVTFSCQISLTLENALIDSERSRVSASLHAVRELAGVIQAEVDPRSMYAKMGDSARETLEVDQLAFYRWNVDENALKCEGTWGDPPPGAEPPPEKERGPEGAIWAAYERGEVFRGGEEGGAEVIVEPLRLRGKPVGALRFVRGSGRDPFTAADATLAGTLSQMWSLGVKNAWLYESLNRAVDDVARAERDMMKLRGELKKE
jgi:DNA-binding response OmpR family regulator